VEAPNIEAAQPEPASAVGAEGPVQEAPTSGAEPVADGAQTTDVAPAEAAPAKATIALSQIDAFCSAKLT
jgi:hypothetical protein